MRNGLNLKGYTFTETGFIKLHPSSVDEREHLLHISNFGRPPEVIILIRRINLRDVNIALTQRRAIYALVYSNEIERIHVNTRMWFG